MEPYDYSIIIIGAGPAGLVAAKFARGLGKKVALIEKEAHLGGECTWTGCVPSKTLINVAHLVYNSQKLQELEFLQSCTMHLDTEKIMQHVRDTIDHVYSTHTPDKLEKEGITVLLGSPSFIDSHTIMLNGKQVRAQKFIIATGSRPFIPPIIGIDTVSYLTNETVFKLKKLPSSMIILGAGPVGIEMASALHRLGVSITVIEMSDTILPREDKELVDILANHMMLQGVMLKTSLKATKIYKKETGIDVECIDKENKVSKFSAESLLIAVGRKPNVEGLGLEGIGVQTNKKGITVTSTLQTSIDTIYACGDVVGPYLFSHMAEYQAVIAVRNAFFPYFKRHVDYTNVLWVTFSAPELASAGLNEQEARKKYGEKLLVYRKYYKDLDRAKIDGNEMGFGKFICDSRGRLIGAHILGARAGEIIHEVQLGKYYNMRLYDFYHVIHAYPTYSELVWQASKMAYVDSWKRSFWIKLAQKIGFIK